MDASLSEWFLPLIPWLATHVVLVVLLWAQQHRWSPRGGDSRRRGGPGRYGPQGRALALALGLGVVFQLAGSLRTTPSLAGDLLNALAMLPLLGLSIVYLAALILALRRLGIPLAGSFALVIYLPALLVSLAGTLGFGPAAEARWIIFLPPAAFMVDALSWLQGVRAPGTLAGLGQYLFHLGGFLAVAFTPRSSEGSPLQPIRGAPP